MATVRSLNAKRIVLLLWLLVAFFYFYLAYDYIRVTMNDKQFGDYLQYIVGVAGNQGRTPKDVRELLLVKAEELALPVRGDQIVVRGGRNSLNVDVTYEVDIEIPLLQTEIYRKNFTHTAKYPQ